jgi:hypothetical protein
MVLVDRVKVELVERFRDALTTESIALRRRMLGGPMTRCAVALVLLVVASETAEDEEVGDRAAESAPQPVRTSAFVPRAGNPPIPIQPMHAKMLGDPGDDNDDQNDDEY